MHIQEIGGKLHTGTANQEGWAVHAIDREKEGAAMNK